MSSEDIYDYWKQQPEYSPTKFDIVGMFEPRPAPSGTIGGYYGAGEYVAGLDELEAIDMEPDSVLVIGADEKFHMKSKTASTVDDRLIALFGNLDRGLVKPMAPRKLQKRAKKRNKKRQLKSLKRRKTPRGGGGAETLSITDNVTNNSAVMRMCDVTDEMLYHCPDLTGSQESSHSRSSTSASEPGSSETSTSDSGSAEYGIPENNGIIGGRGYPDDNIQSGDSSGLTSDEEIAALGATLMSGSNDNQPSDDTDITKYFI